MEEFKLSERDVVELIYFFYRTGYISREFHDRVHELKFDMEVYLDRTYGNWQNIEELVKKVREEKAS